MDGRRDEEMGRWGKESILPVAPVGNTSGDAFSVCFVLLFVMFGEITCSINARAEVMKMTAERG